MCGFSMSPVEIGDISFVKANSYKFQIGIRWQLCAFDPKLAGNRKEKYE